MHLKHLYFSGNQKIKELVLERKLLNLPILLKETSALQSLWFLQDGRSS